MARTVRTQKLGNEATSNSKLDRDLERKCLTVEAVVTWALIIAV